MRIRRLAPLVLWFLWAGCGSDAGPDTADLADTGGSDVGLAEVVAQDVSAADAPAIDLATVDVRAPDLTTETTPDTQPWTGPLSRAQEAAVATIRATTLRDHVDFLADDARGGRICGSPGHDQARDYLRDRLAAAGLQPGGDDGTFFQRFPTSASSDAYMLDADGSVVRQVCDGATNVIARLPGADPALAHETVVVLAHYDHLGVTANGDVYNGATDDAAGVAAALGVAEALAAHDVGPRRSLLFVFTAEEEHGLRGAKAWIQYPTMSLDDVVLALAVDPLGRPIVPDYGLIAVIATEESPELQAFWRQTVDFAEQDVVFLHRELMMGFGMDADAFAAAGIPIVWVANIAGPYYHTTADTPRTVDYRVLRDDARYLARSLLLVGDDATRFSHLGAPPVDTDTLADALPVLEGVLSSQELTPYEREATEKYLEEWRGVIAGGSLEHVPDAWERVLGTMFFIAIALPAAHPGEFPPPFPTDE